MRFVNTFSPGDVPLHGTDSFSRKTASVSLHCDHCIDILELFSAEVVVVRKCSVKFRCSKTLSSRYCVIQFVACVTLLVVNLSKQVLIRKLQSWKNLNVELKLYTANSIFSLEHKFKVFKGEVIRFKFFRLTATSQFFENYSNSQLIHICCF